MTDTSTNTIAVSIISASSAIAAVTISQIITAYNTRKSDIRKNQFDINKTTLLRKIEVGESFYRVNGENVQLLDALIHSIDNRLSQKSQRGQDYLESDFKKLQETYTSTLKANDQSNLINLYFSVKSTFKAISEDELVAKNIYVKVIEHSIELSKAQFSNNDYKEKIINFFLEELENYRSHLMQVRERVQTDIETVRHELNQLATFMKI